MPHYNADCLCVRCKHLLPALDPNIQKAYLGRCLKREWPFTLAITLEGWMECEVFEDSGKIYIPPEPVAVKAPMPAAAAAKAARRVEFYYSSAEKPGEAFPCNIARALELVQQLQARGVDCTAIDTAGLMDRFPIYHKAVSGPPASVRPVFGFKGALVEDFGGRVPALLIFEGDRYPSLAYPRTDPQRGLIRVEQALEELSAEAGG